jgi:hypothetical protein
MINTGMLWLDDDKRTPLEDKIGRAAEYYRDKYGASPNICYVNKKTLEEESQVGSIQVLPVRNVLPNHLWIGLKSV